MYFCEILERIRRKNVEKTRSQWCHIYFCQIPELTICRRNFEQTKSHDLMPYFYVKSSNESAEEMSSKQDLIDAIYFCQKSSKYLTIRRRNFRANKNLIIWCHMFLSNPGTNRQKKNVSKQRSNRSHIYFCANPRTNPQKKCREKQDLRCVLVVSVVISQTLWRISSG